MFLLHNKSIYQVARMMECCEEERGYAQQVNLHSWKRSCVFSAQVLSLHTGWREQWSFVSRSYTLQNNLNSLSSVSFICLELEHYHTYFVLKVVNERDILFVCMLLKLHLSLIDFLSVQ